MPKSTNTNNSGSSVSGVGEVSLKEYRSLKNKLKEIESLNYDSIFLIPCNGDQGWYELAEHSALIYYYEVCQPLHLKSKFMADTLSFYDQYSIGYMRAKGVDNVRKNLEKQGLLDSESEEGSIHVFKLKQKYPKSKLLELEKAEHERRLNNLTPVGPNNLHPDLHHLIVSVGARLHRICNSRLDKLTSEVNGVRIVRLNDGLLAKYYQITMLSSKSPSSKVQEKLESMRRDIYELIIEVQLLGDFKLWSLELCASVLEPLYTIRDLIEKDLKTVIKKGKIA